MRLMGFSLSANRRRRENRHHPNVRAMLAVAQHYGNFTSGSPAEIEKFIWLFNDFTSIAQRLVAEISGRPYSATTGNTSPRAKDFAAEASHGQHPIAAHASWASAAVLPNSSIVAITNQLGTTGMVAGATFLTDEFTGLVKTPVGGKRLRAWRGPAAIASLTMAGHAAEQGIGL